MTEEGTIQPPRNGADQHVPDVGSAEQAAIAVSKVEAAIEPAVRQVVGTVLRGILVSAPGVPAHMLLNAVARVTGNLLADSLAGDLQTLLRLRKGFKDAFAEGVQAAKPRPAPEQPPAPQAASFRRIG
jgi:hypothetical protein